jgi:N-methylhydantoinase A
MLGVRVSALGARPKPDLSLASRAGSATPHPKSTRAVYDHSAGSFIEAPIFNADEIESGASLPGPAVLESETTTILVPEGFTMRCDEFGSYVLTRGGAR